MSHLRFLLPLILVSPLLGADTAADIKGFAPVSVSAANYRKSSRDQILNAVENAKSAINPTPAQLSPLAEPQLYVFVPGDIAESDLPYEKVCEIVEAGLAKKGFVNAADDFGIIREPKKVSLVLRLSYGQRLWRLPKVRTESLWWADGLVPRRRAPKGLHNLGADVVFDERAGGRDDVLDAVVQNSSASSLGALSRPGQNASSGGTPGANVPAAQGFETSSTAAGVTQYGSTREFNIIVVDAFDYQELKTKGKEATRVWSTFVSAPKERDQAFSQILETMVRNAVPYFGETSSGLQVYTDVRAEVKIGELVEVDENGEPKK